MARQTRNSAPSPDEGDDYREVAGGAERELRERGSRFLASCQAIRAEQDARRVVAERSARHHDATHTAWALRLGHGDGAVFRANDAGEPHGTAGAPILAAIDGRGLTNTLVVVTRWFGGVKLGTAGLARAYGGAAAAALDAAGVRTRFREVRVRFRVAHGDLAAAQRVVFGASGSLVDEAYGADARLTAVVRPSRVGRVRERLIAATSGRIEFLEERS